MPELFIISFRSVDQSFKINDDVDFQVIAFTFE